MCRLANWHHRAQLTWISLHTFMQSLIGLGLQSMLAIQQNINFNLEIARKLLLLVEQAHKDFDKSQNEEEEWDWETDVNPILICEKAYKIVARFGFAEYFYSLGEILGADITDLMGVVRKRVPFGFIAHDEERNELYVVFRGTMTPAEWITNLQFKPGYEPFLSDEQLGRAHRGFHKIYTRADLGHKPWDPADDIVSIKDTIEHYIMGCSSEAQVYTTGHSLGGALATLATLHINRIGHCSKSPILYAFANPRAGDLAFSNMFDGLECFRIANSEDIVPTVPFASVDLASTSNDTASKSLSKTPSSAFSGMLPDLDYHHIGIPVYFTNHRGSIADNHILPCYKEALGILEY